ncbi:ABC transporter substrate-binding protein [Thermobifida halotolerans]|uniref:ABC transporter substrate-binding protein n=1 Tax=Thermobifida halotolerans TaxID=483545 RepID=A0AA97M592_9ACTN|nr:ABC transporter substrate-binding protein [Thermobifida halotolerans]UOE21209.1 ABC transporter substrate-binding protein [Thermobifida halotolerans]
MRKPRHSRAALASAALLAVAVGATACGGEDTAEGAEGNETVRVMMFPAQSYRLPVMIAEQEGMFEQRGIKLEVTEQPANLQGMQGLEATDSDVGIVTVGTLGQGWQAGDPGFFFCGGISVLQTTLMAPVDSDLPSTEEGATWQEVLQALEGKKIGIQTPVGSGLQKIFAAALAEAGVEDVTYVNLGGGSSAAIAAIDNGSVDVAQFNPTGTQYVLESESGKPLLYMPEGPAAYKDYYGSGWVAPPEFVEERPETAAAFCETIDEALEFIQDPANRETSLDLLAEDTGVTRPVAELVLDQTYGDFSTELDRERLDTTFDAYVELGILEADPEPSYDSLVHNTRED